MDKKKSIAKNLILDIKTILSIRIIVLFFLLFITIVNQFLQRDFINLSNIFPIFLLFSVNFFINFLFLSFIDYLINKPKILFFAFIFEVIFITLLIYFWHFNQSIYVFLYLINIILTAFLFKKNGAYFVSFLTSIAFSFLLFSGPLFKEQIIVFSFFLNNISFVVVAVLAGYLSDKLNITGIELQKKTTSLQFVKNLNKLIIENIPSGLITLDKDGNVLYINNVAKNILHIYDELTIIKKKNIKDLFPEILSKIKKIQSSDANQQSIYFEFNINKNRKMKKSYVNQINDENNRINNNNNNNNINIEEELNNNHEENHEEIICRFVISKFYFSKSEDYGFIIIFEDLTQVKKLEKTIQEVEKLAAIGRLAAGIAHEIRNPLASISGSIQMLRGGSVDPEDKRLMNIIYREINRLNNLISEFLDFSRPNISLEEEININKLISNVIDVLKCNENLRKDVIHDTRFKSESNILGNRDKLKQAFLNIIINAYHALNEVDDPKIFVETKDHNNKVILKISDNGCGMNREVLNNIFEPFFSTKSKGTGLGLAVTYKIIESHKAKVYVKSNESIGTTFTVIFPKKI